MKLFLSILVLLGLDQWTKSIAREKFIETFMVIDPWFRFRFVENEGVAFSMPVPQGVVIALTILVLVCLMFLLAGYQWGSWKYFLKPIQLSRLEKIVIVLIFAGALGNLIDRIWLGRVTDFISVGNFAIFNLADTWISVAVGLYICSEVFGKKKI